MRNDLLFHLKAEFWPITISVVASTVLVLVLTGWSHHLTRIIINKVKGKVKKENECGIVK